MIGKSGRSNSKGRKFVFDWEGKGQMKKGFRVAVSLTLCVISGIAVAKNLEADANIPVTVGTAQAIAVSSVAILQSIEGQYSSNVGVGLGVNRSAIIGNGGSAIIGNGGAAIIGNGHAIIGNGGAAIIGNGHAIIGNGGAAIIGNGRAIIGNGGAAIIGNGRAIIGNGGAAIIGNGGQH